MQNFLSENLIPIPVEDDTEVFDFSSPETVIFEVIGPDESFVGPPSWKQCFIEAVNVIDYANPNVTGAASYELSYSGFLDYTIQSLIDCPGEGWWVLENFTGYYSKGDGWMTDDNMEFYCGEVRRATPDEIDLA